MPIRNAASDSEFRTATQRQVERLLRSTPYHSLELPGGVVVPGLIGIDALRQRIDSFPIPRSLSGCRVLDVGAASGWNSFEMAARGGSVTAVDCVPFEEFSQAQSIAGADIDYRLLDVDELSPDNVGYFDYVLFLGVLYHLRHPLFALEKICSLTKTAAFVESFVSDPIDQMSDACAMEFYETDELGGQIDNWYGPTVKCLLALCRAAGFVRVKLEYVSARRAGVTCHRRWEPEPEIPAADPVRLLSAVNNRTNDIDFHPGKDEYLCVYFKSQEEGLTREDIRIEVDGLGVNTLALVRRKGNEWQANTRLPPGIATGEHLVRMRTGKSRFGNSYRISVAHSDRTPDVNESGELSASSQISVSIRSIENSFDGTLIFHGFPAERLCCRFAAGNVSLARKDLEAMIDQQTLPVAFLTDLGGGEWEANISLPASLEHGTHPMRLRVRRGEWSDAVEFTFENA